LAPRRDVPAGALGESVRRCALDLAGHIPEDHRWLDAASWSVVHRPDAKAAAYQRARQQTELACRLIPQDGEFLTTLGAAQYRVGNDAEAAATLTLADQTLARIDSLQTEVCLALLALAQNRLGKTEEARTAPGRLRRIVNQPVRVLPQSAVATLREFEGLEQDLAFPAKPFALTGPG
jgi:hypothetical protein